MLSRRSGDGQSVRIPADGSRDVQASIQDIKDALRSLEAKHRTLKSALAGVEQRVADSGSAKAPSNSFNEVGEETVFDSPVTFGSTVTFNGGVSYSGQVLISDGSAAAPGLAFVNDTDTGIFRSGDDSIDIAAGGKVIARHSELGTHADHTLYSEDATSSLITSVLDSNYTHMRHTSTATSSNFYIRNATASGALKLGTAGTNRWDIISTGHLQPVANDTYDVGATSYGVAHVLVADGAVGDPPLARSANVDTGLFFSGDKIQVAENGTSRGRLLDSYHVFRGYRLAGQALSATTWTTLTGYTEDVDRGGYFNATTGVFTAPVAGQYSFGAYCYNNLAGILFSRFLVNGGTQTYGVDARRFAGANISDIIDLAANNTVAFQVYSTVAGTPGVFRFGGKLIGED